MAVLDGWRAISIIFVLAAHLLPLGPAEWMLNDTAGRIGMALFFTLSGFLITKYFIEHDSVSSFLVRRFFRIAPLAWLGLLVALPMASATPETWLANFLFVANLPPQHLVDMTSHYWSLGVEVQFYLGIALIYAVFGARGLYALPFLCLAVTVHRVWSNAYADIVTWRRADEILAGCVLALVVHHRLGAKPIAVLKRSSPFLLMGLLILCSLPAAGPANYFRPYVAALLVGATLFYSQGKLTTILESNILSYLAKISFALYVVHHILQYTWLGMDADKFKKYLKRPILFALTFLLAHLSTFYFEQKFINLAKNITSRIKPEKVAK